MSSNKSTNTTSGELPEILTLRQACEVLNCHPNTLRQWDRKGILIAIRFGERKDRRYKRDDILKLLNRKQWWFESNLQFDCLTLVWNSARYGIKLPTKIATSPYRQVHSWSGRSPKGLRIVLRSYRNLFWWGVFCFLARHLKNPTKVWKKNYMRRHAFWLPTFLLA